MMIRTRIAALAALIPALCLGAVHARTGPYFNGVTTDKVVQVHLLEGWRMGNGRHMAAIQITLAPGWKTYWRTPGQGGIPTRLRLDRGTGVHGMRMHWPPPQVFITDGIRSIGYEGGVILPVELATATDGAVAIEGRVDMGVCRDVCLPVTVDIKGILPSARRRDPQIVAALADRALTAAEAGVGAATCVITPIPDGVQVQARMQVPPVGANETVVFELPDPGIWISDAISQRQGNQVTATADIVPADAGPFALNRGDLRITVLGQRMAVELNGCTAG
ncbi:MAG: hypothetical protein GDA52_02180 [Rhodobacteraceae bacterium]|nr:hypothetical protein [Paracoccaceae bacterium]